MWFVDLALQVPFPVALLINSFVDVRSVFAISPLVEYRMKSLL